MISIQQLQSGAATSPAVTPPVSKEATEVRTISTTNTTPKPKSHTTKWVVATALLCGVVSVQATPVAAAKGGSLSFDANQLRDLAQNSKNGARRSARAAELQSVKRSLAIAGVNVASDDLNLYELSDGVLTIGTPSAALDSVTIETDEAGAPLAIDTASTTTTDGALAVPAGPGSANWVQKNSGNLTILWSGKGEAISFWYIDKVDNDGTTLRDYWGLRRKVAVQPYNVTGVDWSVTGIMAGSYPTANSTTNIITAWEDFDPANDLNGSCNTTTQAVDTPVGGLGISFTDCDKHDMTTRATTPGWYEMFYSQGAVFHQGNRSTGYALAVRTKNASASPSWSLTTRLEFARLIYPASKCTKSGATGTVNC